MGTFTKSFSGSFGSHGSPLNQIFPDGLMPKFDKLYYWYDNAASGPTATRLKILHRHQNSDLATQYRLEQFHNNTEIDAVGVYQLVKRYNGDWYSAPLNSTHIATNIDTRKYGNVNFNGTLLKTYVNTGPTYGKFRAILFDGTFRGFIKTHAYGQSQVIADKAEGRYYIILEAGNYATVHPNLTSLNLNDIIYYTGGSWIVYHEADYTYTDVDTYAPVDGFATFTLFSDLNIGDYKVGLVGLTTKNTASSGYSSYLKNGAGLADMSFIVIGGDTVNYPTLVADLGYVGHCDMSTTIKKHGSAQIGQWIPTHGAQITTTHRNGETRHIYFDGIEKVGYLTGEVPLTEISEFRLIDQVYCFNPEANTEDLVKFNKQILATINDLKIDILYETLMKTTIDMSYSYMLWYDRASLTKLVTDYKEKLVNPLPEDINNVNLRDGANRVNLFTYNDTPGGMHENIMNLTVVNNKSSTNRGSLQTFYLHGIADTYGKMYAEAQRNATWEIGDTWTVSLSLIIGKVHNLINKVEAYLT